MKVFSANFVIMLPLQALNMHCDIGAKSTTYFFKLLHYALLQFALKKIVAFCVENLLHFASKSCYILRQKLLHFALMLHFALIVTFCGVTFYNLVLLTAQYDFVRICNVFVRQILKSVV